MKIIDLDSCKVLHNKLVCDLKQPKFQQDPTILSRSVGEIKTDGEEFKVEAAPYVDQSLGVSIPLAPLPGSPSINIDFGTSWPFTIFPIPTKLVDRLGQSWFPMPFQSGPEDKFQKLPDAKAVPPEELVEEVVYQ